VQRAGPSTGRPTTPAQGDVMQARWGSHGDRPAIALCPSSVLETYELTIRAFNLSERYRTPVVLLMDEVVAHMRERVPLPLPEIEAISRAITTVTPDKYLPYDEAGKDVPPLAPFGEGYRYHITGLFHDRSGLPTRLLDEIDPWLERLFRKIEANLEDIVQYRQEFIAAFEQHQSLLRESTTTEAVIKGNQATFLVAGSGGATAKTRGVNGLIPARGDDLQQPVATLVEWHDLVRKTDFNIFASQGNQRAIMQMTCMAVINRKIDQDIITELATGTISTGVAAAPTLNLCL